MAGAPRFVCAINDLCAHQVPRKQPVAALDKEHRFVRAPAKISAPAILISWYRGGRLGIYGYPAAARSVFVDVSSREPKRHDLASRF